MNCYNMEIGLMQNRKAIEVLSERWTFYPFKKILKDSSGGNLKIKTSDLLIEGSIPVIDQGKDFIAGFTNQHNSIVRAKLPLIVFGDHTRNLKYIDFDFAMGADGTKVLEVINDQALPKFIYYYLRSIKIADTGYNRHFKFIKDLVFPLPPLKTQQRIAAILDNAAALRNKTAQLLNEYDLLAQSIFLEMFGDPVRNPMGWPISTIKKVCITILGGGTPRKSNEDYYNGDIPWVTPKDMKKLYISKSKINITQKGVDESSVKLIPKNSILMVIRSGILKKKLPVALNTSEVTINQDMKAFLANDKVINPKYLMFFFLNSQGYLLSKVRAVTADNIEFNQIKNMKIPLPELSFQNQFAEKIALIEQQKELARQELKQSEDLFNGLLQKAFKGELVGEEVEDEVEVEVEVENEFRK